MNGGTLMKKVTPMDSTPRTDEQARAWLLEHLAAPVDAPEPREGAASNWPPTFCEILIAYLSTYKAPGRDDERPISARIKSFEGPPRIFATAVVRLVTQIRENAVAGYRGARLVGLPLPSMALAVERTSVAGMLRALAWLAALDAEELALRQPALVLPSPRTRRRRRVGRSPVTKTADLEE